MATKLSKETIIQLSLRMKIKDGLSFMKEHNIWSSKKMDPFKFRKKGYPLLNVIEMEKLG